MIELSEHPLSDDYPVYGGYAYVADGQVIQSEIMRGTVRDLRRNLISRGLSAEIITNCDIVGRIKQEEQDESN